MPVQVCDFGATKLYERLCHVCEKMKMGNQLGNMEYLGKVRPDSPYDSYVICFGEKGHGVLITLYANGAGFVSKITVFSNMKDSIAMENSGRVLPVMLYCLGLNLNEIEIITDRLLSEHHSDLWVDRIKRRIILETEIDRNELFKQRISAVDN